MRKLLNTSSVIQTIKFSVINVCLKKSINAKTKMIYRILGFVAHIQKLWIVQPCCVLKKKNISKGTLNPRICKEDIYQSGFHKKKLP